MYRITIISDFIHFRTSIHTKFAKPELFGSIAQVNCSGLNVILNLSFSLLNLSCSGS